MQEVEGAGKIVPAIPHELSAYPFSRGQGAHVQHYMRYVLPIQYLLANPSIERFIFEYAHTSTSARSAMCLLSAVHQQRMRQIAYPGGGAAVDETEMNELLQQTSRLLRREEGAPYTDGDAMAGLHVVSSYLFMGGHGRWSVYLGVALYWVGGVLTDRRFMGPLDAYRNCSESVQFIIRTTMWFDVWSAVTGRTRPRFCEFYRQLFEGEHGYGNTGPGQVDMLSVMGCTNETVLAMSETAALAHWKDMHTRQGDLSTPCLVEKGCEVRARQTGGHQDLTSFAD